MSMTKTQAETVIDSVKDLIDSQDYRPFFFKKLYSIGPASFVQLADHARKYGNNPPRLFVRLLKQS